MLRRGRSLPVACSRRALALLARRIVAVALLALIPIGAAAAPGHGDDQAKVLLARAVASYANGAFTESREILERTKALTSNPALLGKVNLYLGLDDAATNQVSAAQRHFRLALSYDPSLELDPQQYKPSLVELFRSVRRSWEGTLEVSVGRAGAEVWVGSRRIGPAPVRVRLPPGDHTVEIRDRQGRTLQRSSIKIVSGGVYRLVLAPPASAPAASAPAASPTTASAPTAAPNQVHRPRRLWTWILAGTATAAVAVAVGTGLWARADDSEACQLLAGPAPCDQRRRLVDPAERQRYVSLHSSAADKTLAANIAWGSAAGLAVGAVILYFFEGRSRGEIPHQSRLKVGVADTLTGVTLGFDY